MEETGIKSWTEDTTSRERIREIATTLTQPRSVNWIKKQAKVSSWETTKDELETLVEFGQIRTVENEEGDVRYAPDYRRRYIDEVLGLIEEYTREELREEIAEIQDRIDGWRDEYGVDSKGELEASLSDGHDAEGVRERNDVLRRWENSEANKKLLNHALQLHDDARRESDSSVIA
jgi:hypothetical protein